MVTSNKFAFTLIELVVTATILVILTSIGFYSYTQNISDARDGARKTDISTLASQLNLYKRERWAYPNPWDSFEIRNRGYTVGYQGYMNQKVTLSTAERLPLDPELDTPYIYSVTRNKQEFQVSATLENNESPFAFLQWDYKSIAKNILPNIVLALQTTSPVEINQVVGTGATNRNFFVFHNGFHNISYDFINGIPQSDGTLFTTLLSDAANDYWQNSDFRSCSEIFTAGKWITPSASTDEYQILSSTWVLVNTGCLAP